MRTKTATRCNRQLMEGKMIMEPDQFASGQPLVSVIIPAYNAEAFILHTLNSVISQTYKNIEVIVVDDGSHDKTAQIVESIMQRDDRVTLLQQPNSGVSAARNKAIEKSRGEYIAPIDADDIWYPQSIEKQVQCMLHAGPSTGVVYAWSAHIDEKGLLTGGHNAFDLAGDVFEALMFSNFIGNGSASLIRRICFNRIGGYNAQVEPCEDLDLYLRIAELYKFHVVKEFLVGYRKTTGSRSFNCRGMETSLRIILRNRKQQYPDIPLFFYRWSWGHYYLYLSNQSRLSGRYWISIHYLYKAARADLVLLLYPEFYRHLCRCGLRLVEKAVIFTARILHCPSATNFRKAGTTHKKFTISDIEIRSSRRLPCSLNKLHRARLQRIHRLFAK